MKGAFLVLSLAALASPAGASRAVRPVAPQGNVSIPGATPLVQLGGIVGAALPMLSSQPQLFPTLSIPLSNVPAPQVQGPIATAIAAANSLPRPEVAPTGPAGAADRALPRGSAASGALGAAAFRVERAEALVERARRADPQGFEESRRRAESRPRAAGAAPEAVVALNSVMQEVTPQDMATMSDSQLSGVSALILDRMLGLAPAGRREALAGVAALASASARRMLSRRGRGLQETLLNPRHNDMHPDDISVRGVPAEVRAVRPVPEPGVGREAEPDLSVLRHYTTEEGLQAILRAKSLLNGVVPYVQLSPGTFRKSFKDVVGLFFTLPKVEGRQVGVPSDRYPAWVDVRLPKGLPLLEIERGAIYMLPLPGRSWPWVRDLYMKWARGEGVPDHYRRMVEEMDREGGPGPDLPVPVRIVGSSR